MTAATGLQPLASEPDGIVKTLRIWPEISEALRREQVGTAVTTDTGSVPDLPAEQVHVVDLYYRRVPRKMQYDTDLPDCPLEFHQVVADRALADIHLTGGDPTMATIYERRYIDGVKRLEGRYTAYNGADYIRQPTQFFGRDRWAARRYATKAVGRGGSFS